MARFGCGPNRYICSVFSEMRTQCDVLKEMASNRGTDADFSRNIIVVGSLIEEAQILANRMEAGLEDIAEIEDITKELKRLKGEYKELTKTIDKVKTEMKKGNE